ncbi:hypothetical protein JavanS419_0001 [Streptococcus satellite phage Javan419]|uniref:Phage protein n=1 Tax=Streptococcus phocae TaxID=119224 RepID=A0A0P6STC2_9STRE|nr:hypothetical protein [Streptococcus phocae]KPJ23038.1 hypothetical protein AKK44_01250 [Streptococcus phocae]QBX10216.1 hypothetical protein JavanS419_0001 [Streptococcus satellite phage Javan419]
MKKILFLVLALCATVSSQSIKAEEALKWERDPNHQQAVDDNNNPISVSIDNQNKITVTLPKGWSLWLKKDSKNYNPQQINGETLQTHHNRQAPRTQDSNSVSGKQNTSPKITIYGKDNTNTLQLSSIYNDNLGESGLPITITVDAPSEEDKKLTIVYKADGGYFAGSTVFVNSKILAKEKEAEKRKEAEEKQIDEERKYVEQKLLEDSVLKQIRENDHKTWYERFGDNVQDQWANFTSWWRG